MNGWLLDPSSLRGRIALVAGATRGAGRGIAAALGEAGATVVCTGRSTRASGSSRSDYDRPETIDETAELVTSLGGTGVAIPVDHLNASDVETLADRLRCDYGHIDVIVNDIWRAEVLKGGPRDWNTPIWQHDLAKGLRILRLGVETHLITSHYLLPLLIAKPGGLLVEVTDGTSDYNAAHYRISVFYDLAKVSVNRLAFSEGHELTPHHATAVSVTLHPLGVAEICRAWRGCARGRSRAPPMASAIGDVGSAGGGIRLHGRRRITTRRVEVHRGRRTRNGRRPQRLPRARFDMFVAAAYRAVWDRLRVRRGKSGPPAMVLTRTPPHGLRSDDGVAGAERLVAPRHATAGKTARERSDRRWR